MDIIGQPQRNVTSERLADYDFSVEGMIDSFIQPLLNNENCYNNNLLEFVELMMDQTHELVQAVEEELIRNYPFFSQDEARQILFRFDGTLHTCIQCIDSKIGKEDIKANISTLLFPRKSDLQSLVNLKEDCVRDTEESLIQVCSICCCDFEAKESGTIGCGHPICMECVTTYLEAKILDGDVGKRRLTCLYAGCRSKYNLYHLYVACTKESFRKFLRFRVVRHLQANPRTRWCPNPKCGALMLGKFKMKKLECLTCNQVMCFKCSNPVHKGKCKAELDKSFKLWKKGNKNVKSCPRCKFQIEKTRGCNHMTCIKCQYEFCWLCLGKYTPTHFDGPFACSMSASYNAWGPHPAIRVVTKTGAVIVIIPIAAIALVLASPVIAWSYRDSIAESLHDCAESVLPVRTSQTNGTTQRRDSLKTTSRRSPSQQNSFVSVVEEDSVEIEIAEDDTKADSGNA